MRLTTIGTGTAAPSPTRVQSGALVEHGDLRLLVDCGSGVVGRMATLGIDWVGITHVALTHFHADHTSDLATLIFAWRYGTLPPRTTPIEIIGPAGTAALIERMATVFGETLLTALPMTVREAVPGDTLPLAPGCALEARKVPHTEESVAYSVATAGQRVVLSGDLGFDRSFGEWAVGSDILLMECSLPEALAIPSHLVPRECGELAALAAPRHLVLTHFYPPVEATDIEGEVAQHFDGRMTRAVDGLAFDLEET